MKWGGGSEQDSCPKMFPPASPNKKKKRGRGDRQSRGKKRGQGDTKRKSLEIRLNRQSSGEFHSKRVTKSRKGTNGFKENLPIKEGRESGGTSAEREK